MFFELYVSEIEIADLGWILSKNPSNVFKRELNGAGGGRSVHGSFMVFEERKFGYFVKVLNNPLFFVEKMRTENRSSYIDVQISSVSHCNLVLWREVFSSCLKGKYDKQCKRHKDVFNIEAVMGPWSGSMDNFHEKLSSLCLPLFLSASQHPTLGERVIIFKTTKKMTCEVFLRKIYLLGIYLSEKSGSEIAGGPPADHLVSGFVEEVPQIIKNFIGLKEKRTNTTSTTKTITKTTKTTTPTTTTTPTHPTTPTPTPTPTSTTPTPTPTPTTPTPITTTTSTPTPTTTTKVNNPKNNPKTKENNTLTERKKDLKFDNVHQEELPLLEEEEDKTTASDQSDNDDIEPKPAAHHHQQQQQQQQQMLNEKILEVLLKNLSPCNDSEPPQNYKVLQFLNSKDLTLPLLLLSSLPNVTITVNSNASVKYNNKLRKFVKAKAIQILNFSFLHPEKPEKLLENDVFVCLDVLQLYTREDCERLLMIVSDFIRPQNVRNEAFYKSILNDSADFVQQMFLPRSQTVINRAKLVEGLKSFYFLQSGRTPFGVGPTIAPVDAAEDAGNPNCPDSFYLEHPETAFSYFSSVGITQVACENKYMGSRALLLIFRDHHFNIFNEGDQLQIKSKTGAEFFTRRENPFKDTLKKELLQTMNKLDLDFMILDGEILPWSMKAKSLILSDFLIPGECALKSREYIHGKDSPEYQNALLYLQTLSNYSEEVKPELRVFQVIAAGKVLLDEKTNKMSKRVKVLHYGSSMDFTQKYKFLASLSSEHVRPVEYLMVDLNKKEERENAVKVWKEYCKKGEGWVIKVCPSQFQETNDGKMIIPMMKVRGPDFLRLVYGIDYLNEDYFNYIKKRNIDPKRKLSIIQFELQDMIVKCFLNGLQHDHMKCVAAFFGSDNNKINATL